MDGLHSVWRLGANSGKLLPQQLAPVVHLIVPLPVGGYGRSNQVIRNAECVHKARAARRQVPTQSPARQSAPTKNLYSAASQSSAQRLCTLYASLAMLPAIKPCHNIFKPSTPRSISPGGTRCWNGGQWGAQQPLRQQQPTGIRSRRHSASSVTRGSPKP